jgi:4-hydroxy-4-methyl-2-oxoglutarate aldolase
MVDLKDFDHLSGTLYTAVFSDILDDLGFPGRVMSNRIRPLFPYRLIGRAFPVQTKEVNEIPEVPYQSLLQSLDDIKPGEIYVADVNSQKSGFWGELLSNFVRARGGRGAIIDGLVRDTAKIIEMGFPVFSCGTNPLDSKGRNEVIAYRTPIRCGGIDVNPGDLIFADMDGIIVIPREIEDVAVQKALEKVAGEDIVRNALNGGMMATEVFKKYGIL